MPFDGTGGRPTPADALRRERLEQLARVLESVDDDAFDLRDWMRSGRCDTIACAVGWAVRDAWFAAQGLGRAGRSPSYGADTGWRAVRRFFGLDRDEAMALFHAGKYDAPTREAVIARLREYAAR